MSTPYPPEHDAGRPWLEGLLDVLPFPLLLVEGGTGRIAFANRAARRVPLLPPPGSAGDGYGAVDDRGRCFPAADMAARLAARGETLDGTEVTWETPGHRSIFLVFAEAVPGRVWGGQVLTTLTFVDVTRLRGVEGELCQAVEARDEFFSVATHELKDPLFSLQLALDLMHRTVEKRGVVPADAILRHLEVCLRQARRLNCLIENLLDVSRIANHRLQLEPEEFDLTELAHEVTARFREQARAACVLLALEPGEPVTGFWDRLKLEQVLGNLLSNALKYGAGRPVTVRVEGDAGRAVLEVEDQGPGIAAEDQERIFHRFERAASGHRRDSLGLGLYIVRSLVEAHGGAVRLRSAPDQGATFTVHLPRKPLAPRATGGEESDAAT